MITHCKSLSLTKGLQEYVLCADVGRRGRLKWRNWYKRLKTVVKMKFNQFSLAIFINDFVMIFSCKNDVSSKGISLFQGFNVWQVFELTWVELKIPQKSL